MHGSRGTWRGWLRLTALGPVVAALVPEPVMAFGVGGRSLDNPYTIFVVSALIIAGWLAVFVLLTTGHEDSGE